MRIVIFKQGRLGMFGKIRDKAATLILGRIKEKIVNPAIDGIGTVSEIVFRNRELFLTVILEGLEDRPIEIKASDIKITDDASSIKVGKFETNMAFARNLLNRFATRSFAVPQGNVRTALAAAKKVLGL